MGVNSIQRITIQQTTVQQKDTSVSFQQLPNTVYEKTFRLRRDDLSPVASMHRIARELEPDNSDLDYALTEAAVNCINHSSGSIFSVHIVREGATYKVNIRDDGAGYDYESNLERVRKEDFPDFTGTHGRGIHIINSLSNGRLSIGDLGRHLEFHIPVTVEV